MAGPEKRMAVERPAMVYL